MSKNEWNVIGLMSGTSLDGLDIVYTRILNNQNTYSFEILKAETVPYSKHWEQKLRNAFSASKKEIEELTIAYGFYLGEVVNNFIKKNTINNIDFIASHGHTIFHKPEQNYTLQIGDGNTIKQITGLKVICDFRTQDVELGGQGAPLVPIGDKLLFTQYHYCLNLGGFANISFEKDAKRVAYDICPVNIVMNHYCKKLGLNYDEDGKIASSGIINSELLEELNSIQFYTFPPPKSLGFEFVKQTIFPIIEKYNLKVEDVLRTCIAHITYQISNNLNNSANSKVLITGGGAFNSFLINELKKQTKAKIVIPNKKIVNYKEALIFALLGVLRLENKVNCLSSVTGASKDHSSGKIFS
jgi:anhydro-N-acetylmuramic acid kinase